MSNYVEMIKQAVYSQKYDTLDPVYNNLINNEDESTVYDVVEELAQLGYNEEAINLTAKAADVFNHDEWFITLADLYINDTRYDDSLEVLLKVSEQSPLYPSALLTMADLYEQMGLYDVAMNKLKIAKTILPSEPIIDLAIAQMATANKEHHLAIELLEGLNANTSNDKSDILKLLGYNYSAIGYFEETIDVLEMIDNTQHDSQSIFAIALAYYQVGNFTRAIHWFKELLSKDVDYFSAYYYLGRSYIENRQFDEAIETFTHAKELNPYQVENYLELHTLYTDRQAYEQITQLFQDSQQFIPDNADLQLLYAYHLLDTGDFEEVIDYIEDTVDLDDYTAEFDWIKASAYAQLEIDDKTQEFYEKAYETFKDDEAFIREYALYLREIGKREEASRLLGTLGDKAFELELDNDLF